MRIPTPREIAIAAPPVLAAFTTATLSTMGPAALPAVGAAVGVVGAAAGASAITHLVRENRIRRESVYEEYRDFANNVTRVSKLYNDTLDFLEDYWENNPDLSRENTDEIMYQIKERLEQLDAMVPEDLDNIRVVTPARAETLSNIFEQAYYEIDNLNRIILGLQVNPSFQGN